MIRSFPEIFLVLAHSCSYEEASETDAVYLEAPGTLQHNGNGKRGLHEAQFYSQIEDFLSQQAPEAGSGDEEEGEEDGSEEQQLVKKRKRGGGLGSMLSPEMQAFLGCETLARPQVCLL